MRRLRRPNVPEQRLGVAEEGYDASFHTKAWHEARYATFDGPKETFEEYRVRKAKEDAQEQEKERELEDAEGMIPATALIWGLWDNISILGTFRI